MRTKLILVSTCLFVLALSISFMQLTAQNANDSTQIDQTTTNETAFSDQEGTIEYTAVSPASGEENGQEETSNNTQSETIETDFNVREEDGALIIGDPDAPVTITEYSSMSCGHCATFHGGALKDLEKDYVATGQLQIAFYPFPTNKPAMDASKLLECVDVSDRYDFMNLLFEQQGSWAVPGVDHRQKLLQYAALLGLSNDKATECMNNKDIEQEIIAIIQNANAKYGVDSTPTFIIEPGEKVLIGARPYGDFSTEIEAILEQKGQ